MADFQAFDKMARLSRRCIVTEKIDGTNAQIFIGDDGEFLTGSRTRWIAPEDDNFGFARWAQDNKDALLQLGPGRHYGEWWGKGIQRGYGLADRRFSLFNTTRWADSAAVPACCSVVPVLYQGVFCSSQVEGCLFRLREAGSVAAPGFADPEGVVVFHEASRTAFKKTCYHDDEPKSAHPQRVPREPSERTKIPQIMWTGGRRKGATLGYAGPERRVAR